MDPRRIATRLMVMAVVLVAVGVTVASLQQQPIYEASARVLVGETFPEKGKIRPIPLTPTPETLQGLTQEMIHAIDSRPVAEETLLRLGLQTEPAELSDNLSVEQVEGTQFLSLTYESTDPVKAAKTVNTVGQVSSELITERSSGLTATVFEEAMVPEGPVSPRPWRNGFVTLVVGLMLCAGAVAALPGVRVRFAGALGEPPSRQGIGIVERVKEKKLLLALGRRGKLTAIEAALESGLSVEEANRMLSELALAGHLEVTVEHGRLYYAHWGDRGEDGA